MKLLIVDDHPFNLALLRAQLEAEGHAVVEAANGVEALALLPRERVDGVVSDILMPEMDGFRLCLEVRKDDRLKVLPFVFYTSTYNSLEDRHLAKDMGADAYITKPAPVQDILDAVQDAAGRAAGPARLPRVAPDDGNVLKQYSQALVRKLEDKNLDLERTLENLTAAHEQTRRADERYRAMFEAAAVGMTHTDLGGNFVTVNTKYCEITGYSREEALSLNFRDLTHPDDLQNSLEFRARLLAADAVPFEREARLLRKDRSQIWANVTTSLMRADDGAPLHFLSVLHDVTARKHAEEARRESEARFRQMAESIHEVFFLFEAADGQTLYVNPAYAEIFQRSTDSVYANALSWIELVHPDDRERVVRNVELIRASGRSDHEYRILRADGSLRWIHGRTYPIRDSAGQIRRVAGVAEDITDRKQALELTQALESLKRSQDAQRQSENLAALRRMVAGVAHEMNTPIGNALLAATTLKARTGEFARQSESGLRRSNLEGFVAGAREGGEIILRGLEKAAELVRSFKQVASDQAVPKRRAFALTDALEDLLRTHPIVKIATIAIRKHLPEGLCMDGYPDQLGQVLSNLFSNAVLHGFEGRGGGTVTVAARMDGAETVEITVHDDGRGIDGADLKHVFNPFFTTKLGRGGSGVGLSVCHRIVTECLGGEIRASSEPGAGTTLTLRLPVNAPPLEPGAA